MVVNKKGCFWIRSDGTPKARDSADRRSPSAAGFCEHPEHRAVTDPEPVISVEIATADLGLDSATTRTRPLTIQRDITRETRNPPQTGEPRSTVTAGDGRVNDGGHGGDGLQGQRHRRSSNQRHEAPPTVTTDCRRRGSRRHGHPHHREIPPRRPTDHQRSPRPTITGRPIGSTVIEGD